MCAPAPTEIPVPGIPSGAQAGRTSKFGAVRLSPKQAAGAVGAGAMSEPGQCNHT